MVSAAIRIALILSWIFFASTTFAAYNFYYKLSSLSQDVDYLDSALKEILQPAGYELISSTVTVSDAIGSPATANVSSSGNTSYPLLGPHIQNDRYALRVVQFSALKQNQVFSGWIYLVLTRTDNHGQSLVPLKSQSHQDFSQIWNRSFWQTLSKDENPLSFQLEVRANNLHLKLGAKVPNSDLPAWAQARPHFPKATSAQIIEYARRRLSGLLQPMGYQLNASTVNISEDVVVGNGPGFPPSLRIVEGASHSLRGLNFHAQDSSGKVYSGGITLVIANPESTHLQPNSSVEPLMNPQGNLECSIFLSNDVDQNSFPLDIRTQNLRLTPVFVGTH